MLRKSESMKDVKTYTKTSKETTGNVRVNDHEGICKLMTETTTY